MSDTKTLTETFTGRTHVLPSGKVVSVWENSRTGLPPYKDWLTLHHQAASLEAQNLDAQPYKDAMAAINNYNPPDKWMR